MIYWWITTLAFAFFFFCMDWEWKIRGKLNRFKDGMPCTDAVMRQRAWPLVLIGSVLFAFVWPVVPFLFWGNRKIGNRLSERVENGFDYHFGFWALDLQLDSLPSDPRLEKKLP